MTVHDRIQEIGKVSKKPQASLLIKQAKRLESCERRPEVDRLDDR